MDRAHGLDVPLTLEEACVPDRLALLVYDMQVGILGQIEGAQRILDRARRALDAVRGAGARVVFVRHVTLPPRMMGASQLRMWRAWQTRESAADVVSPFPADAPHAALAPELAPRDDEMVWDKVTMSAFAGTPLDIVLRDCGVSTVAVLGVALETGASRRSATRRTWATCRWWSATPAGRGTPRPARARSRRWSGAATPCCATPTSSRRRWAGASVLIR